MTMAKSKSKRSRAPKATANAPDESVIDEKFRHLHYRLLMHTNQLKLVAHALDGSAEPVVQGAAEFVVGEIATSLDELHNQFDHWDLARRRGTSLIVEGGGREVRS
jgi:hypothetical protein